VPRRAPPRKKAGAPLGWLLVPIVAAAWYLRAHHPHYSTAFMDESIYIVYGRMFLSHHFESPLTHPLDFSFGWYLWPMMAATADRLGGLTGVRELTALLGTLTTILVYAFSRRLFGRPVGLASAGVFALLAPAILTSRIATHEAASIFFFALGIWLYVRAWQDDERAAWGLGAVSFFAAFLSKYLAALYFPFFVLLTLRKGRRAVVYFSAPLTVLCGAYAWHYAGELAALLHYAQRYSSLRAPSHEAWGIYFSDRPDFWVLCVLALLAWRKRTKAAKQTTALLWLGAAVIPVFHWYARSDYDYWKTVTYSLVFLTPLAMEGLVHTARDTAVLLRPLLASVLTAALAISLAWGSHFWQIKRFVFWPNATPILAYFDGRLAAQDRVLVDDSVFRYYFAPPLSQPQITDPFFFWYGNEQGAPAYAQAVRDRWFNYIVLDGGMGGEARSLETAIAPELANRYVLRLATQDRILGHPIRIYERENMSPAEPSVESNPTASPPPVRQAN